MLGVARMVSNAAWGAQPLNFASTTKSTADFTGSLSGAGSATWTAGEIMAGAEWVPFNNSFSDLSSISFDQTNVVSKIDYTVAATIRFPTSSNITFLNGDVAAIDGGIDSSNGASFFDAYAEIYNMGGYPYAYWQIYPMIVASGAPGYIGNPGEIAFLIQGGGYTQRVLPIQWDTLANKWITVIISIREDNTFSNWTQGTAPTGNVYERIQIVDSETKEQLVLKDSFYNPFKVANDNYEIDFVGKTVARSIATPDSSNFTFRSRIQGYVRTGSTPGYTTDNLKTATGWFSLGEAVDPLGTTNGIENYKFMSSPSIPETVGGVRAWTNLGVISATDNGTNTIMSTNRPSRAGVPSDVWGKVESSIASGSFGTDTNKI
tara:strand:+ start:1070 stop:2197 length:1128 start_codon:yes stop_codon:yes gene_type:complete